MGIRFYCPNGHKLNVKAFQAGMKGICPYCGAKTQIPTESTRKPSKKRRKAEASPAGQMPVATPIGVGEPVAPAGPQTPAAAAAPVEAVPAAADPGQVPGPAGPSSPVVVPQEPLVGGPGAGAPGQPAQPAPADSSGVADPLAEAGDVVWYVRPASGGQYGPAGSDVMRSWLAEGRVAADSLVWREGWRDWREASIVFPQFGAGRAESALSGLATGEASNTAAATARGGRSRWRRKSNHTQAVVIILLILAVLILSGVFVWVVSREAGGGASGTPGSRPATVVRTDSAGGPSAAARVPSARTTQP